MTVDGCKRDSEDAFIDIDSVDEILVDNFECIGCTNERGSSCISGNYSTVNFHNMSATGNQGIYGGALGFTDSRVWIKDSQFQNNQAHLNGGAVHLLNCDLNVANTTFTENKATVGGAVGGEVRRSVCLLLVIKGS